MAVSRLSQTSLQNAFQKFNNIWDGRSVAIGSMDPISVVTLTSPQTLITFSNIPQTYTQLQIRGIARCTDALTVTQWDSVVFNGDTASNYYRHWLYGNSNASSVSSGGSGLSIPGNVSGGATAGVFGTSVTDILDYTNTNKYKTLKSIGGVNNNSVGDYRVTLASGVWMSTAAITSITITAGASNFAAYTSYALYGVK